MHTRGDTLFVKGADMHAATETIGTPFDPYCGRSADQIGSVLAGAEDENKTPAQYAREDGTYNSAHGTFACLECYITIGAPSLPGGWTARARY